MRTTIACAVLAAFVAVSAAAQDAAAPAKDAITDAAIINTCGARLSKMFARYGQPKALWVARGNAEDDDEVICSYEGGYMFRVRGTEVKRCFFWKQWKGSIHGIKIGDSREEVLKALGDPSMTFKDKDGVVTDYGYKFKDLDVKFFANFDKDGKVWRVEVSSD